MAFPSLLAALLLAAQAFAARAYDYPQARRDPVVDAYFGVRVADPYRWLEQPDAPQTREWVDAQNRLSRAFIHGNPDRAALRERLIRIWDFPRHSIIEPKGGRYFYSRNDGLQNQSVLFFQRRLGAKPERILDPNALSADGTLSVSLVSYSWDGRRLAYGLSSKGSDWQELRIRDVDNGSEQPEVLRRLRFSDVAWAKDGAGFFYNRYPDEGAVPVEDENRHNKVYWHALGAPQSADRLVYERPDQKDWAFSPWVTEDGRYLILTVWTGTDPRTRLYYREASSTGDFIKLFDAGDALYEFVHNEGPVFYVLTDKGAPRKKIVAIDTRQPGEWREVVPESTEVLNKAIVAGGKLVVASLKDAHSELRIYNLDGSRGRKVELPGLGALSGLAGEAVSDEFFFAFTSFLFPSQVYRYDLRADRFYLVLSSTVDFDPARYETRQVFFPSRDGARIPMFLVLRKETRLDGSNPTLLYGYGGFKASLPPSFSISRLLWLENGGVYAAVNLRGGDEYGEEWHQAGMLAKKQNVFDDFIAAAQWLLGSGVTRPDRLAIQGGSNGGLLTAAAMLQRPELFGAVICQVPVIDMLRFHRFTVGHMWIPEYGSAEASADQFRALYAYSPLHNVRSGAAYPPILVTAADTDDRVVPAHAKKFIATLQHADAAGTHPILLRFDVKAGHGGGKPTTKVIEEQADIYAFLFRLFGIKPAID